MDTYTQTFLQDRDLDRFENPLARMGVKSIDEMALLTEQDLESIGMNVIDRRKLQHGIAELSASNGDGSNGIDASLGSASPGSLQAWDSASSSSQETGKKTRKSFSIFRFRRKAEAETESCGSGEMNRSSKSADGNGARRVSAPSSSGLLGSASSGGGYNNGGQLQDTRFETQTHLGLNISVQRQREWDFQQALEAENNHMAVLAMNRGYIDWRRAPKSAYGASTHNTNQGSQYFVGTHKVLSPVTREEVEVPAVRATAKVRGSLHEVMGLLLMYDSQTLRRRMSVLDGTFLYGQVLRVVSPRSADGKSVAYVYPSMPLCTITRNCHQFPEQKSVRDFVVRNHYGYHNEAGATVGVCAMVSVDEHVGESNSSLDSAPVRGRVFEGSGIIVTPSHANTCEVTFVLIATLNESTSRTAGRRRLAKGANSGASQLEAAASLVDSIRVFVERQRALRGDAWCKGDIQAALPNHDHGNDPMRKTSAAAMKRLVTEEEAQNMQSSHEPSLPHLPPRSASVSAAAAGPVSPKDDPSPSPSPLSPPLPPPRTDLRVQAPPQESSQEVLPEMEDCSEDGPPPLEPLVSPRVAGSDADAVKDNDTDDENADSASQEVSSAVSGGRSTPEATNESEAMRLMKEELAEAKRRLQELQKIKDEEREKHLADMEKRMVSNRNLRDNLEKRKFSTMPSPGEKGKDFTTTADEELRAEMERLRNRLSKIRPFLPANIDEDDLDLTLEEAERRMRDAVQKIMNSEDEKDQFEAQNQFEKYDEIVRNHPDYKLREIEKWRKWEEDEKPKNEAALEEMKNIIKPEYFNMSKDQLIAKGIKPKLAQRIHAQKVLRLLYLTPEEIAKIHYGDFTNKYNPSGLDIIEQRAVYIASPEEFANDPTGDKAKWRVNIKEKLAELITKEGKNSLRPDEKRHSAYLADKPKPAPGASNGSAPRGLPGARRGGALAGRGAALNALFGAGGPRGPPRGPRGPGGDENPAAKLFGAGGPRGPPGGAGGAAEDNPVAKLFGSGGPRGPPRGPPGGEDNPVAKLFGSGGPRGPPRGRPGGEDNPVVKLFGSGGPRGPPRGPPGGDDNPVAKLFGSGGPRGPPRGPPGGEDNPVAKLFGSGGPRGPPRGPAGSGGGAAEDNPVAKLFGAGGPRGLPSKTGEAANPVGEPAGGLAGASTTTSQRKLASDAEIRKSLERSFSSKFGSRSNEEVQEKVNEPDTNRTENETAAKLEPASTGDAEKAPATSAPPTPPAPSATPTPPGLPATLAAASEAPTRIVEKEPPTSSTKDPSTGAGAATALKDETAKAGSESTHGPQSEATPAAKAEAATSQSSRPSLSPKSPEGTHDELMDLLHASFRDGPGKSASRNSAGSSSLKKDDEAWKKSLASSLDSKFAAKK